MNDQNVNSLEQLQEIINNKEGVLVYFSTPQCNVCKVLKPKVMDIFEKNYPDIQRLYVDLTQQPEISGQYSVFTVPTILVFLDRKEFTRKSRSFSPLELISELERPWTMMHS